VAPFRARSLPALRRCLRDRHPGVVESAVYALYHLEVRFPARLLSGLVRHPDRRVRVAVATAVGGETDRLAIRLLIDLARDRDGETRNWALFGLRLHPLTSTTRSTDTAEIRDALLAAVRDRHREARGEALLALALRHDERVLEPLSRELRVRPVSYLAVEAAQALGHPSLRAALRRQTPREPWKRLLRAAIAACGRRPRPG
jgi:HEAT repeat protein